MYYITPPEKSEEHINENLYDLSTDEIFLERLSRIKSFEDPDELQKRLEEEFLQVRNFSMKILLSGAFVLVTLFLIFR